MILLFVSVGVIIGEIYAQSFGGLLDDANVDRLQQDLDNEQAFMDCLETTPANECWAQVLEDCTKLLTVTIISSLL